MRLPAACLRRGFVGRLSSAWQRRFGWYPGDWIWRVAAGARDRDRGRDGGDRARGRRRREQDDRGDPGRTSPRADDGAGDGDGHASRRFDRGRPSRRRSLRHRRRPPPAPGSLTAWPAGRSGFTVVLESLADELRALACPGARPRRLAGRAAPGRGPRLEPLLEPPPRLLRGLQRRLRLPRPGPDGPGDGCRQRASGSPTRGRSRAEPFSPEATRAPTL